MALDFADAQLKNEVKEADLYWTYWSLIDELSEDLKKGGAPREAN